MNRHAGVDAQLAQHIEALTRELTALEAVTTPDAQMRRDRLAVALEGLRLAHVALSGASLRVPAGDPPPARLGPLEARLLAVLTGEGPIWLTDIAKRWRMSPRVVSRAAQRLVDDGRAVLRGHTWQRRLVLRLGWCVRGG